MEETDLEATISRLKAEKETAESEARDFEDKMMKAAQFGNYLLERNKELEAEVEKEKQEKHEITLRNIIGLSFINTMIRINNSTKIIIIIEYELL